MPSPNPSGASSSQLLAVSCTSAANCTAVGTVVGTSGTTTLIERWDGTAWTIVAHPDPSGAKASALSAVSCSTDTDCIAVGSYNVGGSKERALIERWDATAWTIILGPTNVGADPNNQLYGVSCTTPTTCTAVGTSDNGALIEQQTGTAWSIVANPGLGGLSAVSCTTPASCTAVGSNGQPFIEHSETADATVIPLTVAVSGSQTFGSSGPSFAITTTAPAGDVLSGTLTCTTVGNPATTISPALPTGIYTLHGSSCSGLVVSGPTAANYQIAYADGTFTVNAAPGATTIVPATSTTTVPSLAFTGGSDDIALIVAAGLVILALSVIELRRRSGS